ncbi:gpn-loop gtpase 3 [Nannochloropsis gaditana]|uniref:GPN-loop GTPase 3 n=1 Tax=Nannochloropsis gaditana TaxID=72520 RepID=W7TNL8_9STRA|nr:gpn-loop gtpase 3 [Nannochloropsis gaditana]
MEYLLENLEWLEERLEVFAEGDYLVFDCPGQVELYSHIPVMKHLVDFLVKGPLSLSVCGVYLIDAHFMVDPSKFVAGALLCLSTMIALEVPQVNIISKADLVDKEEIERVLDMDSAAMVARMGHLAAHGRLQPLTHTIAAVVDDYTLVGFLPLDPNDENSWDAILAQADMALQFGEDLEPREPRDDVGDGRTEDEDAMEDNDIQQSL